MTAPQSAAQKITLCCHGASGCYMRQYVKYAKHATLCLRENVRHFALKARPGGTPSPDTPAVRLEEPKLTQRTATPSA